LQLRSRNQHVPRRLKHERTAAASSKLKFPGYGKQFTSGSEQIRRNRRYECSQGSKTPGICCPAPQDKLRIVRNSLPEPAKLSAHACAFDFRAYFRDFPCNVAPRNMRQRYRHNGQSAAHPQIQMIQRAPPHSYQNVSCASCGSGASVYFSTSGPHAFQKQ